MEFKMNYILVNGSMNCSRVQDFLERWGWGTAALYVYLANWDFSFFKC